MATHAIAAIDADEWAAEFMAWLGARCALAPRFSTNVTALHRDFAAWCEERNDWPCSLDAFTVLLRQAQFTITLARDVTLVGQIGLHEDVEYMCELNHNGRLTSTGGIGLKKRKSNEKEADNDRN
jgi:hypothetical protein